MGGNGGRFATPPAAGVETLSVVGGGPTFDDLVPMEPRIEEPAPDLGRGGGNAIFNALSHYTDDDLGPFPALNGTMLAQGTGGGRVPPTEKPTKPRRKKPAVAPPAKQRDRWEKVRDTTDGKPGGYDIGWMKKLDPRVLKSIEGPYADDVAEQAIAARLRKDPQIAKIEANRKKTTRDIRKANKTTQQRGAKELPSDPLADSVDAAFDAQRVLRENAIRTQMENDAKRGAPKQTVSVPGKNEKVRRADMQTVKRVNYVSDVNTLSGDHAKTRKHLESIRAVKGTDMKDGKKNPHAMLLSGDTADRFEMARDKFDKDPAHAGFRMPVTSVGFGTRGLHEEKQGLGYLGHMLGTTMDLFAYENPNLKADDVEGMRINKYMLERFGRDENGKRGRATLDYFGDDRIEAMGKRTAAGATSADDDQLEAKIRGQYREMSATSERFKGENSLGKDKMDNLRDARTRYFSLQTKRDEAAALARDLAKSPDDESLKTKLADLQAANEVAERSIKADMDEAFRPWKDELQTDIEKTRNDTSKDEAYRTNPLCQRSCRIDLTTSGARAEADDGVLGIGSRKERAQDARTWRGHRDSVVEGDRHPAADVVALAA